MNNPNIAYRHGDVLLFKIDKLPKKAKQKKKDNLVLAEGEVTGHAHRILSGAVLYSLLNEDTEERFLEVTAKTAPLTHEEHAKIEVPEGCYKVLIQREYEPDGWREVYD